MITQKLRKESLVERTERILQDPKTMVTIFDHIANGGSGSDLCEMWEVRHCDIMRWVFGDAKRKAIYNDACLARGEVLICHTLRSIDALNNHKTWVQKCKEFQECPI